MSDHVENILGFKISNQKIDLCLEGIASAIYPSKEVILHTPKWLATINPHSYVVSLSDSNFSDSLKNANWLVPDGGGIIIASLLLGGSIRRRITGSDIFHGVLDLMNTYGEKSVFFLGSSDDVLSKIVKRLENEYPNIRIAGCYSPPYAEDFSEIENERIINIINSSNADVLWVGLTAPKQEKWIYTHIHKLDVKFTAAIGAVFDFYAGKVHRSPLIFRNFGLEWLPRLLQEPKRLWRRTIISAPVFLWHVFCQKILQNIKK